MVLQPLVFFTPIPIPIPEPPDSATEQSSSSAPLAPRLSVSVRLQTSSPGIGSSESVFSLWPELIRRRCLYGATSARGVFRQRRNQAIRGGEGTLEEKLGANRSDH